MACLQRGPIAQLAEQLTLNQLVVGSSPSRVTISLPGRRLLNALSVRWRASPGRPAVRHVWFLALRLLPDLAITA